MRILFKDICKLIIIIVFYYSYELLILDWVKEIKWYGWIEENILGKRLYFDSLFCRLLFVLLLFNGRNG